MGPESISGKLVEAKLTPNEIGQINNLVEAGYFRMKGEAYASDASTDLELDYELVCKIMDDLEKEGKMEAVQ